MKRLLMGTRNPAKIEGLRLSLAGLPLELLDLDSLC